MSYVSTLGHAVKSGDPDRIREATQNLNAAKVEREIHLAMANDHGITVEDRKRLADLLLTGGVK